MPIKKENRQLYPSDWKATSHRIRFIRAQGRCECIGECGLHHERRCVERHQAAAAWANGTIILTVAHLNHDPADCRDENLRAFCQRCHLRYDAQHHRETAAITRRQGKAIGDLF